MADSSPDPAVDKCPVDHTTRAAWLKANPNSTSFPSATNAVSKTDDGNSCDSTHIDQRKPQAQSQSFFTKWFWSSSEKAPSSPKARSAIDQLATDREISTIPRSSTASENEHAPANREKESGLSPSGNWIYPSEKMFFEAMKRKGHGPNAPDMRTIVPLHNAVNERAWAEIKKWEKPYGSDAQCGGPRLHSFMGLSRNMTPKARFNTLLGYSPPFDRHDWVVDRCGTTVEYVIDFYQGRDEGKAGKQVNFYLDVRPKLNSWEGWKMRASKTLGLV